MFQHRPSPGECHPIRRVAASGLVAIGVLCALCNGVFRYIDNHFYTPETFFENTTALADDPEVRERLFNGFRTEIVAIADGVDLDAEAVTDADTDSSADETSGADTDDEEADSSAEPVPITDERIARDQAIEAVLLDVFDSPLYGEVFDEQLRSIQPQIVRSAELPGEALLRDPGIVEFDARRLYQPIYTALAADVATAEITSNPVPPTYGVYKIADRDTTLNAAWWLIANGPSWKGLTFAGAVLSLIGAVVIAERRPTRAIQFGGGMIGLALVVIVVAYIVRAIVPVLAAGSDGDGAVTATYAATVAPLVSMMIRVVILGAIVAVVGAVAKLIWPDDWVYGQVADDRGVRSIRRRRGARVVEEPQVPAAAAVPVAYPGYPAQPYGAYPPGWVPPYPGQPYSMPGQPYPAGPYAQPVPAAYMPAVANPQLAARADVAMTGENPTIDTVEAVSDARPKDAAGIVPQVVTTPETDITPDDAVETIARGAEAPVTPATPESTARATTVDGATSSADPDTDGDGWNDDGDW